MGVHSYLPDGTQACWRVRAPGRFAVDVETIGVPPPHLAARAGEGDFWRDWVVAEVVAKLTDTPILTLAAGGLPVAVPSGIDVVLATDGGVVACFGRRWT